MSEETCPRCKGTGYDPEPEPICCRSPQIHCDEEGNPIGEECCGSPEYDWGPCRECGGAATINK